MPRINGHYYTPEQIREIKRNSNKDDFEEFLVSGVIAGLTGEALVGAILGGSLLGGIVGELFDN